MTRLQKKCLIAAAGTHLLVVVAVLCSGFITTKPKPDDSQVLDVIPPNLIDAAFNSGVKNAQPPPPAPMVKPPEPQPQPTPEPPKPVVVPQPKPEPTAPPEKIQPDDTKPADIPEPKPKPKPHKIEVDLKPVARRNTPAVDNSAAEAEKAAKEAAKEAKRVRDARLKAIQNAARAIKENASSSTTVDMSGDSTVAYANYASIVKSVYTQAWIPPTDTASDDANVKVSVTIANDGRVINAHIVGRSGDASVDRSVQTTLDRVREIAPFPDGSTDKERTYIINFNLKAKRMLG
jgi:TonB family protein